MEIDPTDVGQDYNDELVHQRDTHEDERSPRNNANDNDTGDERRVSTTKFHAVKWKRLRRFYRDQYLELFNASYHDGQETDERSIMLDSQIGAVLWTAKEKKTFFIALAKVGRHNLLQLSNAVATKSQVEIAAYIDSIRNSEMDRQLFTDSAKNISLPDIPAAIEISARCERLLENAADALCAYQEQYDVEAGQRAHGSDWLVDRERAEDMDAIVGALSDNSLLNKLPSDGGAETEIGQDGPSDTYKLFNLTNFLDLSENFFMNCPRQTLHSHWKDFAEPGQGPALTLDALRTMFDLVVEHIQKVFRTALHVAKARITDSLTSSYTPSWSLRRSDVIAALDLLDLPHDAWDFWTEMARRNDLRVVTGSHNRGESRAQPISHEAVEAALSSRRGKGRRRSMSIGGTSSGATEPLSATDVASTDESNAVDLYEESSEESVQSEDGLHAVQENQSGEDSEETDLFDPKQAQTSIHDGGPYKAGSRMKVGRDQWKMLSEEAQEAFAERVDQVASAKEENRLRQVLGKRLLTLDEGNERELGSRPRTTRKTREDIESWSCAYQSEWESFGRNVADTASPLETSDVGTSGVEDDKIP